MVPALEKYLELVKDYKFSDLYNIWSFIACTSACLERRVWLNEEAVGPLYPTLYIVLVGNPATIKTSAALVPVNNLLRELENPPFLCSNQLTPAALVGEFKESHQELALRNGGTAKTSPLFVVATEFGVWFKDIGGGELTDVLLDFYDSRPIGGIWKKNTLKHGKQELINPALTILGCTTPKHIQSSRLADTAGVGFTSRVIFVCEPNIVEGTPHRPPLNPELVSELKQIFERVSKLTGPFLFDEAAANTNDEIFARISKWKRENPSEGFLSHTIARKHAHIKKVAMCFSALRGGRNMVSNEDLLDAERLVTDLESNLSFAFGYTIEYNDKEMANKILAKIPYRKSLSSNEILKAFKNDGQIVPKNFEFERVLGGMVVQGALTATNEKGEVRYAHAKKH